MRKLITILAIFILLLPSYVLGAGTVTQTITEIAKGQYIVKFACNGDSSDGSIEDTDTASVDANGKTLLGKILGKRLVGVKAYPTSGGTAPDAADVFILDDDGLDLLGSVDGGTTAYNGLNLIHATLVRSVVPVRYLPRAGFYQNYWPIIDGALTLRVSNQGTASADYTIELKFK